MRARTLFEAFGIGVALTLNYTWGHLSPRHIEDLYLRMLPVNSVVGGALIDLLVVSAAALGLILLLERFDAEYKSPAWAVLIGIVPAVVVRSVYSLMEIAGRGLTSAALFTLSFLPLLFVCFAWNRGYQWIISAFRWTTACLGVCFLWMAPRLIYSYVEKEPHDVASFRHTVTSGGFQNQLRVVWILFDELSYDQAFDHRQSGLTLRNFDGLRAISTSFSNVRPAGYYTDEIIPAILRGKPIVDEQSGSDGMLIVRAGRDLRWEQYDPQATIFGDAHRLGWTTGIAGWFNPYCRLFVSVVDDCSWSASSDTFRGHMRRGDTTLQNALAPLLRKAGSIDDSSEITDHRAAYTELMASSQALLEDSDIRFVFLHLPVPHPPGLYDRKRHSIQNGGSYLDNLALADEALGKLRVTIGTSPAAKNTILVVSSDHSMRVPKWRGGMYWTSEDEQVFHARFDPRPVLLVHFPDQRDQRVVPVSFDELQTHELLEMILQGRMNNSSDVIQWINGENSLR